MRKKPIVSVISFMVFYVNGFLSIYTAISRKFVGKNVHATIPKGNMGYNQYTVPNIVAVEPFVVFF